MDYRNYGGTLYVRIDKGEDIIRTLMDVCRQEGIASAVYSGIGGCDEADIRIFIPEEGRFESRQLNGMLELVSLNGSLNLDDEGSYEHHTHGVFAYKDGEQHCVAGGHLTAVRVLLTGEIELRPVTGGELNRKFNPVTGTRFWDFRG